MNGPLSNPSAAALATLLLASGNAAACATCRPAVGARLYDADFPATLAVLTIPIALLTAIGLVGYFFDDLKPLIRSKEARLWHTTPEPDR